MLLLADKNWYWWLSYQLLAFNYSNELSAINSEQCAINHEQKNLSFFKA